MNREVKHALAAFGIALAALVLLMQLGRAVGFVGDNLQALVAVVFLYVPVAAARIRDEDLADYGFTLRPLGRGLAIGFGSILLVFPLFAAGYYLFCEAVCAAASGSPLAIAKRALPGQCATWGGLAGAKLPGVDLDFLEFVAAQIIVTAIPEELFFRGFVLGLLEKAIPPRRRLLGGGIGWALVISSALFALSHIPHQGPHGLAVFFPGLLFGWMCSATKSILAPAIAHAASNIFLRVLERIFF